MIMKTEIVLEKKETGGSLFDKLAEAGAKLCVETLEALENKTASWEPQGETTTSYARMLDKELGNIKWEKTAVQIESEARQRAAAMIEDAERQVKAKVGSIEELTAAEERKLTLAQNATKSFLAKAREVCSAQLNQLAAINGELDLPEDAPAEAAPAAPEVDIDEAVRSIEEGVSRASAPEPELDLDLSDFDLSPAPKRNNLSSTQSFNL
jgi:methionyl-tRNA formyltransferase